MTGGFVRRLRAVAAIDIAGYSKLMSVEETRTHARVNELFGTIVKPVIDEWRGLQIERAGDGLLVLFESSTDAVRCALQIQQAVERHQEAVGSSQRLRLRIGVNVGDIIIDGDEIAGDDVNIAVRLQALAEPGAICISASVRGQLHDELDGAFEDLGDVALKNIGRPIHVYQVRRRSGRGPGRLSALVRWRRRLARRWLWPAVWAVALIGIGLLAAERWARRPAAEPPPMSLAVLPFDTAAGGPAATAAGELVEHLTRSLAATGWLEVRDKDFVAQALSAHGVPGLPASLNVRYALQGQLSVSGDRLVAEAYLTDAASRGSLWTQRLAVPAGPGAARALSDKLVVELRQAVYDAEAKRFVDSGAEPRTALEHKLRGDMERRNRHSLEGEQRASLHYQRALELDPTYLQAMISLAYARLVQADLAPGPLAEAHVLAADDLSKQVITRRPDSAPGWQLRSEVLARQWLWDAALAASDRALELDPARAYAHGHRASLLIRLGRTDEALAATERTAPLARQRDGFVQFQRCRALMAQGNHRGAVEACQHTVLLEDWWLPRAYLVAGFALLDEPEKAAREKDRLEKLLPQVSIRLVRDLRESDVPAFRRQIEDNLVRGLRLAGVPDA